MSEAPSQAVIEDDVVTSVFDELDREVWSWRKAGDAIHLWWRDDDASDHSPELQRLVDALSGAPLTLAIIPGQLSEDLIDYVACTPNAIVVQHGWMHADHSAPGAAPSEYPASRDWSVMADELKRGQGVLRRSFADRYQPTFVPPWHRCAPQILRALPELGFQGVSLAAPLMPWLRYGFCGETHVEIDLCDWPRGGAFIGAEQFAQLLTRALRLRRHWRETRQPIGVVSHHATMGEDDCAEVELFLRKISGAVRWHTICELTSDNQLS